MGLVDAAKSEDRAVLLRALRDKLAASVADAELSNVAALAKQLRETVAELDSLPAAEGRSASDDLAARRSARRSASAAGGHPAGSGLNVGDGGS